MKNIKPTETPISGLKKEDFISSKKLKSMDEISPGVYAPVFKKDKK